MARTIVPWLLAGGAVAALLYGARSARGRAVADRAPDGLPDELPDALPDPAQRNAGVLQYRPVGTTGEPYPDWVRELRDASGVYIIRERQRDRARSNPVVYVGESHTGRLYQTLTRHFQMWRRHKRFWAGQYGGQSHDPGLTYDRARCTVAVRVLDPERAITEEARLIKRLRPRDNLIGQPTELGADEVIPF